MTTTQAIKEKKRTNTLDDAMEALFTKLDEGLDDLEQGRMISSDELFAELDALDRKGV